MSNQRILVAAFVLLLVLAGCGPQATPAPAPTKPPPTEALPTEPAPTKPAPTEEPPAAQEGLLISELLPGVHKVDNNQEFVELYNAGPRAVDLNGWTLWYQMADGKEEEQVYAWVGRADIPGHGHYLLVRAGKDLGTIGDAEFTVPLFERKGGVALRDPDGNTVDTLVWGEGPTSYLAGSPAAVPEDGASLERLPGGDEGNGQQSGDHAADLKLATPNPQNSGDPVTPLPEERLAIGVDIPASVEPGVEVTYSVEVQNLTSDALQDVRATIPIPDGFEVISLPDGAEEADGWIEWTLADLAAGASETGDVFIQSPWTYLTTLVRGAYVESDDGQHEAYAPPQPLDVKGGAIPIGTARTLTGKTVTVEGLATMYTDGFYAGSTGTKFYMEDESGGIQVYCPGGKDLVHVEVGDRVRVSGEIEVYRDSVEIIPATYPDDVEVIEDGAIDPEPAETTISAATQDEALLGRLIAVEGTATRIEEFTYSYEIDLMDDEGNTLLVYVEKDAGLTAEPLDVGNLYRLTGISELYNGSWQIKPRLQTDMAQVFAPELMLEMRAGSSILPGGTLTYTLTAYNHTDAPLTNVQIEAGLPAGNVAVQEILDDGEQEGTIIIWRLPELDSGEAAEVRYLVSVDEGAGGPIEAPAAVATADEWLYPAETAPLLTFVGSGVPIWAIQGPGMTSPYVREQATTEGIVIGAFPELEGFWIQEAETDDDPTTSAGLFVLTGEWEAPVILGDSVRVSGKVRERSGQTLLEMLASEGLEILSSGNELPEAVELDPPLDRQDSVVYYEALEGMLVQAGDAVIAVGPTSKYGETPLVRAEWGIERVMRGDPSGLLIFIDDGSSATHYDLSTLPFALQTGDELAGGVGPLAYTYENFKIEPIALPEVASAEQPLPALDPAGPNQFSIATFNVEDMFDPRDPHPSDPPLPTRSEYELDLAKMANAIVAMGAPTVVGLQEVENINVLADLAAQDPIAGYGYESILVEGTDSRGIDVGYLVRGDRATVEGSAAYPAPEGLTSRPPLLVTVTVHLESGDQTVYVLNNHFTSMSGGEKPTEPQRKAQAAWNVTLVEQILEGDPDAHVVVLGDLNSFYDSPPIDVLRESGLRHIYEFVDPERPYTYIYQGESETLDHILVTPGLYGNLVQVVSLHIDADYPPPIPGDPSPRRVSDHDPLIAVFFLD